MCRNIHSEREVRGGSENDLRRERIIPLEQALEELPAGAGPVTEGPRVGENGGEDATHKVSTADQNWDQICFYISPIGEEDSEHRSHADLFLGSIVEPALEEFKLKVVRADKIGKAGMITAQILEYILKSRLVVADLSYHNPNVFYELCLRHACRFPTVQIISKVRQDSLRFSNSPARSRLTRLASSQWSLIYSRTRPRLRLRWHHGVERPGFRG